MSLVTWAARAVEPGSPWRAPKAEALPAVDAALRAPGRPLEPRDRAELGSRFGHRFGDVRVHDDASAAMAAGSLGAAAFTVGRHVVFGAGRYRPETPAGMRLVAHEFAHVVQQSAPAAAGANAEAAERQAAGAGDAVLAGTRPGPLASVGPALQGQQAGTERDPIHEPIVEGFRRRQGLSPVEGEAFGPSAGEIKYRRSPAALVGRLGGMTAWELARFPQGELRLAAEADPGAASRFADFERAARVARGVHGQLGITSDPDVDRDLGRLPTAPELAILNRSLGRILRVGGVGRALAEPGARGAPTAPGSTTPTLAGRVRIMTDATQYGIKYYRRNVRMGMALSAALVDGEVRQLWTASGITATPAATITEQERNLAGLVISLREAPAGFYSPPDDVFYLGPQGDLTRAADVDLARHETVHLLGGRERTRQAFIAEFGAGYIPYWSTFEEGTAELLSREASPTGGSQQPTAVVGQSTSTSGGAQTTVTVTIGPGYDTEVDAVKRLMQQPGLDRATVLRAYFTGAVPKAVFAALRRLVRR